MSENENTAIVPMDDVDELVHIAAQAEKRIDAVLKIKRVALKVTNAMDWVNQKGKTEEQDKPYLQASGSEKVAGLFNISWRLLTPEPALELEPDGNFTYTYSGEFSMGKRTIYAEGSRSSCDKFFTQYEYSADGKSRKAKSVEERDNKRDVKMSAYTNLLANGITRILGIRNLTYADLLEFAGIKKEDLQKVVYKDNPKANPPATPVTTNAPGSSMPPPKPGEQEPPENTSAPLELTGESYIERLRKALDGNVKELERLTAFYSERDKKEIAGCKRWDWLKEPRAKVAFHKWEDEQKAGQREPGED